MRVAVYGTLRKGCGNHPVIARHKHTLLDTVRLAGYSMYNVGGFPAVVESLEGAITAELYDVDPMALAGLDRLEGFHADSPQTSMYLRRQVGTPFGPSFIYIWNSSLRSLPHIPGGDWFKRV